MTDLEKTAQAARDDLYEIIRSEEPFENKARDALEIGKHYLGVDNGHLTRIDPETDYWEVIVSTDSSDGQFPEGLERDLETTYCRRTIEGNSQIALYDAPNQGWADDPAFETQGMHCYHGIPLILDDETYGTACFVAEEPCKQFSDGDTMFTELIARLLERELERERHDAQLTRQTNLALVLNRVLRHNIRNDMSVIRGFTQLMADKLQNFPYSATVLNKIDKLIKLAEQARQLDRIVAAEFKPEPTDITVLVEEVVETISQEHADASIFVEYDDDVTAAVMPSFERALIELIENAVEYSGDSPTVTISVEIVTNAVKIRIEDNGPGLASHETAVLETGAETPLTHGTGLGLWLSHWIVTSHDGSIDASVTDEGTTMTITIPRTTDSTIHQDLMELTRARDQYQAAFEAANDAMVILNNDAQIIDTNPEAGTIYGLDQQTLLGQPLQRFLPDEFDFAAAWQEFQDVGQKRDTVMILGADGVNRQVEYSATTEIVPGQHLVISRDITEQKQREERYDALFNNTYQFMGLLDPDGQILEVNGRRFDSSGSIRMMLLESTCGRCRGFSVLQKPKNRRVKWLKMHLAGNSSVQI